MTREEWLLRRTFTGGAPDLTTLLGAKAATRTRVSVVLPAKDVAPTVGAICSAIRRTWMDRPEPLVDELVVMDGDSRDATARIAADAGAAVYGEDTTLTDFDAHGKGAAMWKSLAVTTGEVVVWIDADIVDFPPNFVPALVAPIIGDPGIGYVKGYYTRPLGDRPDGGGRVTEICARPLINRFRPELAGFVQPLAGEAAGRRSLLEQVPFSAGYGVEIGLLWDLVAVAGLPALAQVDLGSRRHANQATDALGRMAYEIIDAVLARDGLGPGELPPYARPLARAGGFVLDRTHPNIGTLPPMASITPQERR